jgi:hypothetical protein
MKKITVKILCVFLVSEKMRYYNLSKEAKEKSVIPSPTAIDRKI